VGTLSVLTPFLKNTLVPEVFARLPFGFLQQLTGVNPLVPYYHGVVSEDQPAHIKHLYPFKSVTQFKRDLDVLLQRFEVLDLRDMVSALKTGQPLPRRAMVLQFDDGFSEIYHVVAPILREKGVTATFFLIGSCLDNVAMPYSNKVSVLLEQLSQQDPQAYRPTVARILAHRGVAESGDLGSMLHSLEYSKRDVLDAIAAGVGCDFDAYLRQSKPYLSSEQVRELLAMGFTVGAHSMDHPKYSLIPLEEQISQTLTSIKMIRDRFALPYSAFAFPHGDDNLSDLFFSRIFAESGVDVSFGNIGKRRKIHSRHFPRLVMEKGTASADRTVGRYYAASLYELAITRHHFEQR
jgi:peptidoglycan/xylan/chitin deacetylase (PgdA/CDA1 family)